MHQHSELFIETGKLLNLPDSSSPFGVIDIYSNGASTGNTARIYFGPTHNTIDNNALQKLTTHFGTSKPINADVYFFIKPSMLLLNSFIPRNENEYFAAVNVFPFVPSIIHIGGLITGEPCTQVLDVPRISFAGYNYYLSFNSFMELVVIKTVSNLKPYEKLIVDLTSMRQINNPWSPSFNIKEYSAYQIDNRFAWRYKNLSNQIVDVSSFY